MAVSTESRWVSRVGVALTALGLGSALFVILRLIESWRVTPASAMARAMLGLAADPRTGEVVGIDPARVDQLVGDTPGGRFPVALCLAALIVIAGLVAVAIVAGNVAVGSATLAPPVLSRQPCIVVLAMIPALLGGLGVWLGRLRG